jgi:hypothetical protein
MLNPVTIIGATKSAFTQVASGTASVAILAANGERIGATIVNTDANALFLRLDGGTATSANYSVSVAAATNYTVPFRFQGAITGIWAGDGTGHANVTEFTA